MGGTAYTKAGDAAGEVAGFDALSVEARIGIIAGIVALVMLAAAAVWYLKRKHATYDRVDGHVTDSGDLAFYPEVCQNRNRAVTAAAGHSARDLEAQFVNDMVPPTTNKTMPVTPTPTALVRGSYYSRHPASRRGVEEARGSL